MSSPAFGDLSSRIHEVRVLADLDPGRAGGSGAFPQSSAINRACLVLLCAHLEGYLEDVAVSALDVVGGHGIRVDALPLLLRALHAEEHLKSIEGVQDVHARAPRIMKMFKDESPLWATGQVLTTSMLRPRTVCAEMSNPGSREVRQFLELIGVKIDEHLTAAGKTVLLDRVNGLVARRNAIAHGDIGSSATSQDVDTYIQLINDLASEIDQAVSKALQSMCAMPTLPW